LSFSPLLNGIMHPYGYTDSQVSLTGGGVLVGGMIGVFTVGFILDKSHAYKLALNVSLILVSICLFWLAFTIQDSQNKIINVVICAIIIGIFISSTLPTCYELCVECTYPTGQGTSVSIMMLGAQLVAVAISFFGDYLQTEYQSALLFDACILTFAFLLSIFGFKGRYLRMEAENTPTLVVV